MQRVTGKIQGLTEHMGFTDRDVGDINSREEVENISKVAKYRDKVGKASGRGRLNEGDGSNLIIGENVKM